MSSPAPDTKRRPVELAIAAVTLLVAAVLLFARLGHYALWDDEANTALNAEGVLQTGDTTALIGDNVVAFREGANLRDLHDRLNPPLQIYLDAPALALFGDSAWAARLPFALCGLMAIGVLLAWCWQAKADRLTLLLFSLGLLGNVSFFLYCRQARYYAAAILLTVVMSWLIYYWDGRRRTLGWLAVLGVLLYAANYLTYFAFVAVLVADYCLWGRKRRPLAPADWATLLLPQAVGIAAIAAVWNPLGMDPGHVEPFHNLGDRLHLFWWNWRDLDRAEFGALPLLALAPLLYFFRRDALLLRAPLALLVYVAVITLLSPQPVEITPVADIRYLVPVIPLCIFIEVRCLRLIRSESLAILAALVIFGTNILNGGFWQKSGVRSTLVSYVAELAAPPDDPYNATAAWINAHVAPGQSVYVLPNYATYPLMFHAPQAVYAWQLRWPAEPQFAGLPAIHFQGRVPPDYLVAFGPNLDALTRNIKRLNRPDLTFLPVAALPIFWHDTYRPELFWHTFGPYTDFDPKREGIYIFKCVPAMRPAGGGPDASPLGGSARPDKN